MQKSGLHPSLILLWIVGLTLTFLLGRALWVHQLEQQTEEVHQYLDQTGNQLFTEFSGIGRELATLATYIRLSHRLDPDDFLLLTEQKTRQSRIDYAAWLPWVPAEERITFEKQQEDENGLFGFKVRRLATGDVFIEPTSGPHLPVTLIEPREFSWLRLTGRDMLGCPQLKQAVSRSIESAQSELFSVPGGECERGMYMITVVYSGRRVPESVEARKRMIKGVAMVRLNLAALVPESNLSDLYIHIVSASGQTITRRELQLKPSGVSLPLATFRDRKQLGNGVTIHLQKVAYWSTEALLLLLSVLFSGIGLTFFTDRKLRLQLAELTHTRDKLTKSEKSLKRAQQIAHLGNWSYEPDRDRLQWSRETYHLFGQDPESFSPTLKKLLTLLHPDDRELLSRKIREAVGDRKPYVIEYRITPPNGRERTLLCHCEVVEDRDGVPRRLAGTLFDVTDHRRAEQLRKNLGDLLDLNLSEVYIFCPVSLQFRYVNRGALQNLGYTREEMQEKSLLDLGTLTGQEFFLRAIVPLLDGEEEVVTLDTIHHRKDGSEYNLEMHLQLAEYDGEQHCVAVGLDTTERNHKAVELLEAKQKAESATAAKSIFLANMSHELRTPLNAILGFSQLMARDASLGGKQLKNISTIQRSGTYLLELINDVLDISMVEAGRVVRQNEVFDLSLLLEEILEMFVLRAEKKGLQFSTELADRLPRYVKSDRKKIRQVLTNLLGNAVKFTDHGSVTLWAWPSTINGGDGDEQLNFAVEDTGPGISVHEQEELFQPFVQASCGVLQEKGSGLGLSISRNYARLLDGDVTVESEPGKGATFRFYMTAQVNVEGENAEHRESKRVTGLVPGQPDYRILVCEDQADFRELMCDWLQLAGYRFKAVADGKEAVEAYDQWHPHFIWMDMRMPVMDGYTATGIIKARPGGEKAVIVALSADAFLRDREGMLESGCDDFVAKPCSMEMFFKVMGKHLGAEYMYEEENSDDFRESSSFGQESEAAGLVTDLLVETREALKQAVILGDSQLLDTVLATIQQEDESLAFLLRRLAEDYEYERILNLIGEPVVNSHAN